MNATSEDFRILRRPVVTEKSYAAQGTMNQYSFRVESGASKRQIKHAIESIFEVKVEKVQVINMPGKPKRRGAHEGFRSGYRKAVVRLMEGETLDVTEEA